MDSPTAQHIGLVGNTYTISVAGKDTNDRFCVIDCMCRADADQGHIGTTSKRPSSFLTANQR